MKLTEPPRKVPRPGCLSVEVVDLADEIMSRHPAVTFEVARSYARQIVVFGRIAIEEIRVHGKLTR